MLRQSANLLAGGRSVMVVGTWFLLIAVACSLEGSRLRQEDSPPRISEHPSDRPDRVAGRAGHPQLQGGGTSPSQRRVVQGRRAGGHGPRRPPLAPHAVARRFALLPARGARPQGQPSRRGDVRVRGTQLPGRGREPERLARGRRQAHS
ncbi:unnamed protein product [Lampetra fluviatilis]